MQMMNSFFNQTEKINTTEKIQKLPEVIIIGSPKGGMW